MIPFNRERFKKESIRKSMRQVIVIIFFLYIVTYLIEWKIMGYLPFFTIFRETQRHEWGIFGLHLFISSIPIILIFTSEYLLIFKPKKLDRLLMIGISVIVLVTYFFLLNRLYVFMWLFVLMVLLHYLWKRIKWGHVTLMLTVLFGIYIGIGSLRQAQYVGHFVYNVSDMKFSREYANFSGPYMYIAMNLENVANGVENLHGHSYGTNVFDAIFALLQIKRPLREYLHSDKHQYLVVKAFTTYTYAWYFYADFGIIGVVAGSLLWGYVMGGIYYKLRREPTIARLNMFGLSNFIVFLSFFTFLPMMLASVFQILLLFIAGKYIEKPNIFIQQ